MITCKLFFQIFIKFQHQTTDISNDLTSSSSSKKPAKKPKKPKAKKDSTSQQTGQMMQTSHSAIVTSQTQSQAKIVQTR